MEKSGQKLPAIPLRNIVVFPSMIVPLYVGREKSLNALEMSSALPYKQILLVTQKNNDDKDPAFDDLYSIGTLAKILQLLRLPDGTIKVLVEGISRIVITGEVSSKNFLELAYTPSKDSFVANDQLKKKVKSVVAKFDDFVKLNKKIPSETLMSIINIDDPSRLSDMIVSYLTLSLEEKQTLLETTDVSARLAQIDKYLIREVGLLDVEKKLHTKVQDQIEKVQKEYYLKEKLKEIQKELGTESEDYSEQEEYKRKIDAANLPADVQKKAVRELSRLEKLQSVSAEANVIRTYLDWLIDIPWEEKSKSVVDLTNVKKVLNKDHYGLNKVKNKILDYLAVFHNTQRQTGSILLFSGPPGVGKTSIAQSVATAMNREFYRISLGGLRDEAELRGHRRTYVGAMPGKIIQALAKVKTKNPVILLDEVDKLSQNHKGDPTAVLMEILDPAQNNSFVDNYLDVSVDLSQVLFIATANNVYEISKPLLDRMDVISLTGYSEEEKIQIAKQHLIPALLKGFNIKKKEIEFTEEGLRMIATEYTREAGLRNLQRSLSEICRKYLRNKLEGKKIYKKVSRHNIHHYLGYPKYSREKADVSDEVGVVKGLAWTEAGGDILPIEATVLPGKGELLLTGQLGEVMQESAKAALTFVRSRSADLGLKNDFYKESDIHINVTEGAIPKDGPSAGIAMAVTIASAFSGLPVRGNVAMTGEVTLRGRVLKIGGLKEKVLAAIRNEIDIVLFPYENRLDLKEFSSKITKKIKLIPVKTMDEVMFFALKGYQKKDTSKQIDPRLFDKDQLDNYSSDTLA